METEKSPLSEKEGAAETTHDELTQPPFHVSLYCLGEEFKNKVNSEKKGGVREKVFLKFSSTSYYPILIWLVRN